MKKGNFIKLNFSFLVFLSVFIFTLGEVKTPSLAKNSSNFAKITNFQKYLTKEHNFISIITEKGQKITCYYLKRDEWKAKLLLPFTKEMIEYFKEIFGSFPHQEIVIIETKEEEEEEEEFKVLPGLILLGKELWRDSFIYNYQLEQKIAYAIALMWWPLKVKWEDYWLKQSIANYASLMYLKNTYGRERKKFFEEMFIKEPLLDYLKENEKEIILISLPERVDRESYQNLVILKGTWVMEMLMFILGEEKFVKALRGFFLDTDIKMRTTLNFTHYFNNYYLKFKNENLSWFFNQWLNTANKIDYELKMVKSKKRGEDYITEIAISQKGKGSMPVDVLLNLSDGKNIILRWKRNEKSREVITKSKINYVEVNPENTVLEKNRENNKRVSHAYWSKMFSFYVLGIILWNTLSSLIVIILSFFFKYLLNFWKRFREKRGLLSTVIIFLIMLGFKALFPFLLVGLPENFLFNCIFTVWQNVSLLKLIIIFTVGAGVGIMVGKREKMDFSEEKTLVQMIILWFFFDSLGASILAVLGI
ncbi:hypothetical protein J7M02_04290 [Candidatus Aerophobetes bacterium]|nr:hypothetical protein [Candidatus Aerophobetes bacterium]